LPGLKINDLLFLGNTFYSPKIPAVTIECGFIFQKYRNSAGKEVSIADQEIQSLYAKRISEGVMDYASKKN
jgi:N-acetylmuramoyl-L-alanine amidase